MSGRNLFPIAVGILAIVTGCAVLPRVEEQTEMLMRDGAPRAGLEILSASADTETEPMLAMQAIRLNKAAGRVDAALDGLHRYVARWPNDTAALVKMADVSRSAMRTDERFFALQRLVAMKAPGTHARELMGLYRQRGDGAGELSLISSDFDDPVWTAEDYERAGSMLIAQGDEEAATQAYRLADQRANAQDHECRFKLLRLLVAG